MSSDQERESSIRQLAESYNKVGLAHYKLKDNEKALAAFDQAIAHDPTNADYRNSRGAVLFNLKQYTEALAALDQATKLAPTNALYHKNRGNALFNLKQYKEAVAAHDKAIELDPNNAAYRSNREAALRELNRPASNQSSASNPSAAPLVAQPSGSGNTVSPTSQPTQTATTPTGFQTPPRPHTAPLESPPPKTKEQWNDEGDTHWYADHYPEALAAYERALELDPEDGVARTGKGNALYSLQRYEAALGAYERALELDPEDDVAWHGKGKTLSDLQRHEEALAAYEQELKLVPEDALAWHDMGNTLKALGRTTEAEQAYQKARELGYTASATSQPTQAATTPAGFQMYTNSDHAFRIAYPGDWQQEATPSGSGSMFISGDRQKIFIVRNFGTSQADPATGASAVLSTVFSKDDDTPSSPQPVSIGGQSWTKAEGDGSGGSRHQVAEAVLYKGNAFLMRYASPKASFESDASQFFTPMEQSFQFLEGMALLDVAAARKPPKPTRVQAMVLAGRSKLNTRRGRIWAGVIAALLVILVVTSVLYEVVPASDATVTLLPKSHHVQQSLTVLVSTQANQSGDIHGQLISYTTPTQTQTAQATGTVHHNATVARGNVVISGISLNAGGSADIGESGITGNNGVTIFVESFTATQGATITVPAHAGQAGSGGNIYAYDINLPVAFCRRSDFLCSSPFGYAYAQNPSPFTGGVDAYDQAVVTQSDIDTLTKSLTTQLTSSAQSALAQLATQQMQPGEQTALPTPQCTPTVHADHQVGDVVGQVTASGTVTCYQIVYAQQDFLPGVIHAEQQQVDTMYGQGYALVGAMLADTPVFQSTDATQGTATLLVNANSIWVYQVNDALKAMMAQRIVEETPDDAKSLLLQKYRDIQEVTVVLHGFGSKLPANASAIHIAVQAVPGLHA